MMQWRLIEDAKDCNERRYSEVHAAFAAFVKVEP